MEATARAVIKGGGLVQVDELLLLQIRRSPLHIMQATAWAAINGAGLALVLPCCQSLVADYFRPEARGSGFACLFTASAIGEHWPSLAASVQGALVHAERQHLGGRAGPAAPHEYDSSASGTGSRVSHRKTQVVAHAFHTWWANRWVWA